jgi:hypothetical protein
MRGALARLSLLALPALAAAGETPRPLFWPSPADFSRQVDDGQAVERLELHLLEYASDPRWRSAWAAARYTESGFMGEYGSTTSNELYARSGIALNLFPTPTFQIRYDRRQAEDDRFRVSDQRLEALWYPGRDWALVLTGWPEFEKEYVALGLGIRVGAPRSPNGLDLRVVDERTFWNEKSETGARFTRRPLRVLGDGFLEAGPWRLHGSIDWGLEYRAAEEAPGGRQARGLQRLGDVEVELRDGGWEADLRITGAQLARSQADAAGGLTELRRRWGRAVASVRRSLGAWSAAALTGWASQRDGFASPSGPTGTYSQDAWLFGLDGSLRPTAGLEVGLGYLGAVQRRRRDLLAAGPLFSLDTEGYFDKAHLRAAYGFGPRMSIQALLSQDIRGWRFGGGSVQALLVP